MTQIITLLSAFLSRMKGNRNLFILLAVLLLFTVISFFLIPQQHNVYPPYVSFSPAEKGLKGLYLLLEENGYSVHRWQRSWLFLPKEENHLLVSAEPLSVSGKERMQLREWVRQGNDAILLCMNEECAMDYDFMSTVEAQAGERVSSQSSGQLVSITGLHLLKGRYQGEVFAEQRLSVTSPSVRGILFDEKGPLATAERIGAGTIYHLLHPQWLTNENILKHHHLEMIWPLFSHRNYQVIWFDEYHHGIRQDSPLAAAFPGWIKVVVLQTFLLLALWIWQKGKRYGPVLIPQEFARRRGDETIRSIAGWYQRKSWRKEALAHQVTYFRLFLQEKKGIPLQAEDEYLLAVMERNTPPHIYEKLVDVMGRLQSAEKSVRLSSKEWMSLISDLDQLRRELSR